MKLKSVLKTSLLLFAFPMASWAQTQVPVPVTTTAIPRDLWGARAGDHEITLGGSGGSNRRFDDSFGGINGSYGLYLSDTLEVVLRQAVNYSNPDVGSSKWNGSTFVAIDQHFASRGVVRPYVGLNLGGVYGDSVQDSWAGGLEVGAKIYVQARTFVFAQVEYSWLFEHPSGVNKNFSTGQYRGSLGVGFNL